jgi:hypothetical protein
MRNSFGTTNAARRIDCEFRSLVVNREVGEAIGDLSE